MSHPSRTSRIPWSGLVITALTAGLVWLFVRDLDAAALRQAFASAHLGLVALAVLTVPLGLSRDGHWLHRDFSFARAGR
jgi:hypothetical protein